MCEASSTLDKEAYVGQKNRSVTGNTGRCQDSAEQHFTGEYILQFLQILSFYRQQLHRREERTMFVTTCKVPRGTYLCPTGKTSDLNP